MVVLRVVVGTVAVTAGAVRAEARAVAARIVAGRAAGRAVAERAEARAVEAMAAPAEREGLSSLLPWPAARSAATRSPRGSLRGAARRRHA